MRYYSQYRQDKFIFNMFFSNVVKIHNPKGWSTFSDIAKAKGEIISNIQKGGTIILNRDDSFFNYFKQET